MILIDEHLAEDGVPRRTWLEVDGSTWRVRSDTAPPLPLPAGALAAVMGRYGRPLTNGIDLVMVEEIVVDGVTLRRVQFRAAVDASARDWLVWIVPGAEPLAALARAISAPLLHLAAASAASM